MQRLVMLTALAVMILSIWVIPANACPKKWDIGDPIVATGSGGGVEVCAGDVVNLSVSATDQDHWKMDLQDDYPSEGSFNYSWDCGGSDASTVWQASGSGEQTITCTVTDTTKVPAGEEGTRDGESAKVTFKVTVVSLGDVSGPAEVHQGVPATFSASTNPSGMGGSKITWSGGSGSGSGLSYTTTFTSGGKQKVTATMCDESKSIDVLVLVPCEECCQGYCQNSFDGCSADTPCGVWYDPAIGNPCKASD